MLTSFSFLETKCVAVSLELRVSFKSQEQLVCGLPYTRGQIKKKRERKKPLRWNFSCSRIKLVLKTDQLVHVLGDAQPL